VGTSAVVEGSLVLVVEDEREIGALMREFLEADGFAVVNAESASTVLKAIDVEPPDCVLLDIMLPDESGFDLCRRIREHSDVPVLFLSARDTDADKLRGLGLGADDYIVKSATPAEVVARVKAVVRRSSAAAKATEFLRYGRLEVDLAAHEVRVSGRVVRTTAREFELLRVLVEHPRQVFGREQLFELVWGAFGDRRAVPVYVRRLREKLEANPAKPELITTVWGVGYRFDGRRR
jgi:DNA-binding response OmpR family regulator